jgi:uncharacterized protein DUF4328
MTSQNPWQVQAGFTGQDTSVMRPTRVLSLLTCAALAMWTVVVIASAITAQLRVGLVDSVKESPGTVDLAGLETSDTLTAALTIAEVGAAVLVAGSMIAWLFRVRANAVIINDEGQRWGKPWLVFGWIVPIANFYIPKQIVEDIWTTSKPTTGDRKGTGKPLLVSAWWIIWWLYLVVDRLASKIIAGTARQDDLAATRDLASMTVLIAPIGILAALLAAAVIWRISRFQDAQAVRIASALA